MESMRANVPPEAIQADFQRSGPSPRHLEDPRCNSQPNVRGDHLGAGNPFGNFAALVRGEPRPIGGVSIVQRG